MEAVISKQFVADETIVVVRAIYGRYLHQVATGAGFKGLGDLTRVTGIPRNRLKQYEQGQRSPDLGHLEQIASVTGKEFAVMAARYDRIRQLVASSGPASVNDLCQP